MNKNEQCIIKIEDMSLNGEGIGKYEGYTLFVKDAIVGDLARVKVTRPKKNYGYARLEEIIEPSPWRVEPACPHHRRCGGCQLQAMAYEKQLEWKANKIRSNLERIGGLKDVPLKGIIGMEDPYRYRNKAQYPVGWSVTKETDSGRESAGTGSARRKTGHEDRSCAAKNTGSGSGKENLPGKIVTGFYAGRTHVIVDSEDCLIGQAVNGEILRAVKAYMTEQRVIPYDEQTGRGLVRHVLIRSGYHTGEIMVCMIINGSRLPKEERLIERLRKIPGMASIMLNVNRERTNVILGKEVRTLWGKSYITDRIGDVWFEISPLSFFQVNPVQTEKLYQKALEYACGVEDEIEKEAELAEDDCGESVFRGNVESAGMVESGSEEKTGSTVTEENVVSTGCGCVQKGKKSFKKELIYEDKKEPLHNVSNPVKYKSERISDVSEENPASANFLTDAVVWDLYCGIGTISLFLAQKAKQVYGVEIVPEAVEDARRNAAANGMTNVEFFVGKAEEVVPRKFKEEGIHADVVVVDPPRKGCDEALLETIVKMAPKRVVYVSCDSATMARDVKYLTGNGYEVKEVTAVDMFPMTVGVESVVKLTCVNL